MRIEFSTEVETWQEDGPDQDYLNGEPYSYRGSTNGRVTNVTAAESGREESASYYGSESLVKDMPNVSPGDTLYVVVVGYTSGDTFGRDGGHTAVLDAFADPDMAEELMEAAAENTDEYKMTFKGVEYYCPWVGYFENMEEINVWEVTVRKTHQYSRWDSGVTRGFKRGH
jgi:hypothetical protein